jgi:hypothetical protein
MKLNLDFWALVEESRKLYVNKLEGFGSQLNITSHATLLLKAATS